MKRLAFTLFLCAVAVAAVAQPHEAVAEIEAALAEDRWRAALEQARLADERYPDSKAVTAALAQALLRAGRVEEADEALAQRAEHSPRGWVVLARLRAARGRNAEALAAMERAFAAAPEDPWVAYWSSAVTRDREETIARLEHYLAIAPETQTEWIEAARGTLSVLRELGDRAVWTRVTRPERVEIPLRPIRDAAGRPNGYVIRVQLGERRKGVKLLLDTGAGGLFVSERIARKHGLEALATETTFGGGGDRHHRTVRGRFSSVRIGELSFTDGLASASGGEFDPYGRYHGLIGLSVFAGYRVVLDLPASMLRLEPLPAIAEGQPYWLFLGQTVVRAQVGADRSGLFLLDTGATRTVVDLELARQTPGARIGAPITTRGFGGQVASAMEVSELAVAFLGSTAGARLSGVDLSLRSRLSAVRIDGFLGLDALSESIVALDTVAQTISLQRIETPSSRKASRGAR